jgi:hypothetical protein
MTPTNDQLQLMTTVTVLRLDRLTILANHLDTVSKNRFYLGSWFCNRIPTDEELQAEYDPHDPSDFRTDDCGTVGCAVGHACWMPEFNAAGLRVAAPGDFGGAPEYRPAGGATAYRHWEAVRQFFGLNGYQSYHLFSDSHYPDGGRTTPAQVAERIRAFVREHAPPAGGLTVAPAGGNPA